MEDIKYYFWEGNRYFDNRQYAKSIKCYKQYLKENKDDYVALNNLGITYIKIRKINNAIRCFKEVLNINKSFSKALYNLSYCYFQKQNYISSYKYFSKYVDIRGGVNNVGDELKTLLKNLEEKIKSSNNHKDIRITEYKLNKLNKQQNIAIQLEKIKCKLDIVLDNKCQQDFIKLSNEYNRLLQLL